MECDRCGFQEQTSGVMLLARIVGPGIPSMRPELPDGWTRPRLPNEDGSADDRELCPGCKADLFRFMAGAQVTDTRDADRVADEALSAQVCPGCGHLRHSDACPDYVAEVGACGCKELTPRERMKELGIDD